MHQKPFGGQAPPGPAGGAYTYSAPLAGLKGWAPWKGEGRRKGDGDGKGDKG